MKKLSTIGCSINKILALVGKGKNDLEIGNTDSELLTSSTLTIALAGHKFSVTFVMNNELILKIKIVQYMAVNSLLFSFI